LVKGSDWHCLRGGDAGQTDAGDEGSRDELPHDGFSWIDEVTPTKPLRQRKVIFIIPLLVDPIDRLVQSGGGWSPRFFHDQRCCGGVTGPRNLQNIVRTARTNGAALNGTDQPIGTASPTTPVSGA
jgi:hypothetical protein